ncbi:MAG: hypothetical protein JWO05_3696 [Gemmatimonadetes bacterium]|nr:hypothetical protein [Gemmatimonadota bacterium]
MPKRQGLCKGRSCTVTNALSALSYMGEITPRPIRRMRAPAILWGGEDERCRSRQMEVPPARLAVLMDEARARLHPVRGDMDDATFDALVKSVSARQYREELAGQRGRLRV